MARNSNSGQKFISRNRKPRVHITYEDPYDAEKLIELPFVMGVLADLSGNASQVAKPDMADRKFLDIDMDNFDKRMAAIEPAVSMKVKNRLGDGGEKLSVNLKFTKMDDFSPAAHRAPGSGDGQAPAGARAAVELAALHGRQGRGRGFAQEAARRSGIDGGDEEQARTEAAERRLGAIGAIRETRDGLAPGRAVRPDSRPRRRRGGRVRATAETEFQASHRTSRDRSRERRPDAGHPGARGFDPDQGRSARHDRGDDRASRREAYRRR